MLEREEIESRIPRKHYDALEYYNYDCVCGPLRLPGHMLVAFTRLCAPNAAAIRQMLLALRRDVGMSRGELAAVLAVAECTLKSWERGTRSPSLAARRLIWLVNMAWRETHAPGAVALLAWRTVPRAGADTRAVSDTQVSI